MAKKKYSPPDYRYVRDKEFRLYITTKSRDVKYKTVHRLKKTHYVRVYMYMPDPNYPLNQIFQIYIRKK